MTTNYIFRNFINFILLLFIFFITILFFHHFRKTKILFLFFFLLAFFHLLFVLFFNLNINKVFWNHHVRVIWGFLLRVNEPWWSWRRHFWGHQFLGVLFTLCLMLYEVVLDFPCTLKKRIALCVTVVYHSWYWVVLRLYSWVHVRTSLSRFSLAFEYLWSLNFSHILWINSFYSLRYS